MEQCRDAETQPQHQPDHPTTTWPGMSDPAHSRWYVQRFAEMAVEGADLHGEARLVDVLAPRGARVLDAGCGPGRLGGQLLSLGHSVVGVDLDPALVAAAEEAHPTGHWVVADLADLDLPARGVPAAFDGVLLAGNVLDFITAPHRADVVRRLGAHLREGGFLLVGCRATQGVGPADLDALLPGAGLRLEHRFATWDLRPWHEDADFAVSVLRR